MVIGSINGQPQNIKIDEGSGFFAPEEPSIKIDPKNPLQIVAGSNINNVYYSKDGGASWTKQTLKSKFGVYGDPCLIVDTASNFYFFHLSDVKGKGWNSKKILDRLVCQKSCDGGKTWSNGTFFGKNKSKDQDKEWATVNPINNEIYVTWTQFDKYGSTNPKDSSIILFTKSTDSGETWEKPIRLNTMAGNCLDSDSTAEGAVPTVGPNGEIYVTWSFDDYIYFNKSLDNGKTWLPKEQQIVSGTGGWNYDIPGILRSNGLPIISCDVSNGPNRGTLYVNWTDQRNGEDNTDNWLVKSTDGGDTWSLPKKINDDNTSTHQFLTWMDVDPLTGNIYTVFYDRRLHTDETTDVYLAYSLDGGNSFINEKINETSFKPNKKFFFGDYNNISVYNGIVRPIWTQLTNDGKFSIWTALIKK